MSADPTSDPSEGERNWHRALGPDELPEGRVTPITCGDTTVAIICHDGGYAALDNACRRQGEPLGEGSTTAWVTG